MQSEAFVKNIYKIGHSVLIIDVNPVFHVIDII